MRRFFSRLRTLFFRHRHERDLQDEFAAHLRMDTQQRIESGAAPDEAQRAAHRDFGNTLRIAEDTRASWGWLTLEQFRSDIRHALRIVASRLAPNRSPDAWYRRQHGEIFSMSPPRRGRALPSHPDRLVSIFSIPQPQTRAPGRTAFTDFWRRTTTPKRSNNRRIFREESHRWFGERSEKFRPRVTANFFMFWRYVVGRALADDRPGQGQNHPESSIVGKSRFGGDPGRLPALILTSGRPDCVGAAPEFRLPCSAGRAVPIDVVVKWNAGCVLLGHGLKIRRASLESVRRDFGIAAPGETVPGQRNLSGGLRPNNRSQKRCDRRYGFGWSGRVRDRDASERGG